MLTPYRVLDLTDEKGQPAAKILADLGADVIKVEPPDGDPSRRIGPFVDDDPDPEKSLRWFAHNANKRGVTIDLESADGRTQFEELAASADVVMESFTPGHMEALGLRYERLAEINPGLVLVSISPFGQTGPYKHYKGPDIVTWAMGGFMSVAGEPDRPPAHVSDNAQSSMNAAGEAAIGALLALEQRRQSGRGQHVDVSIQEAVLRTAMGVAASWDMWGTNMPRDFRPVASKLPWYWRCRDGHVVWITPIGPGASRRNGSFVQWLRDTEAAPELLAYDWDDHDPLTMTPDEWETLRRPQGEHFAKFSRRELYEAANRHGFGLFPSSTASDLVADPQLEARGFWQELEHPELNRSIRYPGPFAKASRTPPTLRHRAPLIGEHNAEILNGAARVPLSPGDGATKPAPGPTSKPLADLKVADFSWLMIGPMTVKPLADYGAQVIHVESSVRVDNQRTAPPHKDGILDPECAGDYSQVRTGNRSITLDIASPEGLRVAKRIIAWADIVFDNFAVGTMQRLGLGYDDIRAINPEAIVLSCNGQGPGGPHSASKGGGGHYAALAGLNELTGWPAGEPGYLIAYSDFIAPRFNVPLLLAALDYRRRSGVGQTFDTSQFETSVLWLPTVQLDYAVNGRVAERLGNRQPEAAPHGAYRCAGDRWCAIAVTNEAEWGAFKAAIGSPEWTADERFATLRVRKQHEDDLDALVERWTLERSAEDVMHTLQAAGVPAGAVQRGQEVLNEDPQLAHRGFWQELEHPALGSYRAPQHAFRLPDAPCELKRSRLTGEDTDYVLREMLEMSDDEVAELALAGVLQ